MATSSQSTPAAPKSDVLLSTGLTRTLVNNFRFQVAVTVKGQSVLMKVFQWHYQGGPSVPIKTYLFDTLKFTNVEYNRFFIPPQRELLNSNEDCTKFDISLLHILLNKVCGLTNPNHPVLSSSDLKILKDHIGQVKSFRNDLAHASKLQPLTDIDLKQKLLNLENILSEILRLAGKGSKKSTELVNNLVKEVHEYFQKLLLNLRELDFTDMSQFPQLQEEIAKFKDILKPSVQEDCEKELCTSYPDEFEVELVHWVFRNTKVRPSLTFTEMVIEEDVSLSRPSLKLQPQRMKYQDLLKIKGRDGHVPDVLIVSGEGGVGKSTLLKYLVERWVEEKTKRTGNQEQVTEIQGVHHISPLLFFQLRETTVSTWEDMLDRRLSKSIYNSNLKIEDFGILIKQMKPVVLLDGYDEAHEQSARLVSELFDIPNIRIIITTRPGSLKTLTELVPSRLRTLNVKILGIRKEDRLHFIKKTLSALPPDLSCKNVELKKLETKLSSMAFDREFSTPLNLELLVILEVTRPDSVTRDSSTCTVYQEMIDLIQGKVEDRRTLKCISDCKQKINEYMNYHEEVALRAIIRNEHDLSANTVKELEMKCQNLHLPSTEILSGFFTLKRTWQHLKLMEIWSYPHGRFQEQWAANYVVKQLLAIPQSSIPNQNVPVADNPIMKIFAQTKETLPNDLLHKERIQHLLVVITCLLAKPENIKLLEKLAPFLISLVSFQSEVIDTMLIHLMESKSNSRLIKACADRLTGQKQWMTFGKGISILPAVLLQTVPLELSLAIESPKYCPLTVLNAISERKIDVHILSSPTLHPNDNWDKHMEILAKSSSQCSVTSAMCRLSATGVKHLPLNIEDLDMSVDLDAIQALASRLPSFKNLMELSLEIELTSSSPLKSIPPLPLTGRTPYLTVNSRRQPPVPCDKIDWWCDVLARLKPPARKIHYSYLHTTLAADGDVNKLLKGLQDKEIYANHLVVDVDRIVTEEDRKRTKEVAKSLKICEDMQFNE